MQNSAAPRTTVSRGRVARLAVAAAVALPLAGLPGAAFAAPGGPVSVTINGAPLPLSPPPITRAGRVFVPLRQIFQALGATVVYQGGVINATGRGGRTISLTIGQTTATVGGQAQPIDSPPFIIGASTYVPLRFVGQALGAIVNYDGTNNIVAINAQGGGGGAPPPQAPAQSAVDIRDLQPPRDGSVQAERPTISANFSAHVDPNSVHVSLDGRDVTSASTLSESGLVFAPQSPLQSGRHTVVITGKDTSGQPFERRWSFSSGTAQAENFIKVRGGLADGSTVSGSNFAIDGDTLPNAHVHIVAGASRGFGGAFSFPTGSYSGDTTADGSGHFHFDVSLQTVSGGTVSVDLTSTDPATKGSAELKLRLQSQ